MQNERIDPDPMCEWCEGTGWRASRPAVWYRQNKQYNSKYGRWEEVVTTMFPCGCGIIPTDEDDDSLT